MKTNFEATEVSISGVGQIARASIKASAKLFNFFSDQIYADKERAIWRELVANGIDGQKINGCTRAPEVTLPSILDPIAKVRDWGCSMDHEFMMNQFMAFTDATTKENSNDFIGGFGIGSKSPLAYTEQYSVKCYKDGKLRIYSIFKDDTGCPSIAFLAESDTDEQEGVEVSFPVRQDDIQDFNDVVVDTLKYFDPLPKLLNTQLELTGPKYSAEGAGWGVNLNQQVAKVIVGGVAYPFDRSKITYEFRERYPQLTKFSEFGIDMYLPIGSVNIALSREHITHDEKLFQTLETLLDDVQDAFEQQVSQEFANFTSLWEATKKYTESLEAAQGWNNPTRSLLKSFAKFNGEMLRTKIARPNPPTYPVKAVLVGDFSYKDEVRYLPVSNAKAPGYRDWGPSSPIRPASIDMIVLEDTRVKPRMRMQRVIEDNPSSRIMFIQQKSPNLFSWDDFLEALGSPPESIVFKLSEFDPIVRPKISGVTVTRPFKCYNSYSKPRRDTSYQSSLPVLAPNTQGLYIRMDNFEPISGMDEIHTALVMQPAQVVWLNTTDFKNSKIETDPDWLSVDQAIEKVKQDYVKNHKELKLASAFYDWYLNHAFGTHEVLEKWSELSHFPIVGPLARLNKLRLKFNDVNTLGHQSIRTKILGVDYEDKLTELKNIGDQAKAKHPLIYEFIYELGAYQQSKFTNDFINNLF